MQIPFFRLRIVAALLAALLGAPALAGETTVAVAANFTAAAKEIGAAFTAKTGHTVSYSFGATGQLYTQITQGAPFDVFLAADQARPEKAVAEGLAVAGSRFTYATGQLVLWSADPARVDAEGKVLADPVIAHVAIADPATAPYGAAAVEAMQALGVYDAIQPKLVTGKSISQTFEFAVTGAAPLAFVAGSQVIGDVGGSRWVVPATLYTPIRQDAVLLTRGAENAAATDYVAFLKGDAAKAIIARYGYGLDE